MKFRTGSSVQGNLSAQAWTLGGDSGSKNDTVEIIKGVSIHM